VVFAFRQETTFIDRMGDRASPNPSEGGDSLPFGEGGGGAVFYRTIFPAEIENTELDNLIL
jgi:hypothetical protein